MGIRTYTARPAAAAADDRPANVFAVFFGHHTRTPFVTKTTPSGALSAALKRVFSLHRPSPPSSYRPKSLFIRAYISVSCILLFFSFFFKDNNHLYPPRFSSLVFPLSPTLCKLAITLSSERELCPVSPRDPLSDCATILVQR